MSDNELFGMGILVTVLVGSGLLFTIWEFHKMTKKLEDRRNSPRKDKLGLE